MNTIFKTGKFYSHIKMSDVCFYVAEIVENLDTVTMKVLWVLKRNCRQLMENYDIIEVRNNDLNNYYELSKENL